MHKHIKSEKFSALVYSVLLWFIFLVLLYLGVGLIVKSLPPRWERLAHGLTGLLAGLIATAILIRINKTSFTAIGLNWESRAITNLFKGLAIGILFSTAILSLMLFCTEVTISRNTDYFSINDGLFYLTIIPLALMEEIVFRAYPFIKTNRAYGLRFTQVFIALAFAVYHVIIGWSLLAAFFGPFIWSFVFGLFAYRSKGIAIPTGIHIALNVFQPIVGLSHGTYKSIWQLDYKHDALNNHVLFKADSIGMMIQIIILILAIYLTERSIKKDKLATTTV